jgi:hypothetical protein
MTPYYIVNIFRYHGYYKTYESYFLTAVTVLVFSYGGKNGEWNWLGLEQMHVTAKWIIFLGCPSKNNIFRFYHYFTSRCLEETGWTDGQTDRQTGGQIRTSSYYVFNGQVNVYKYGVRVQFLLYVRQMKCRQNLYWSNKFFIKIR